MYESVRVNTMRDWKKKINSQSKLFISCLNLILVKIWWSETPPPTLIRPILNKWFLLQNGRLEFRCHVAAAHARTDIRNTQLKIGFIHVFAHAWHAYTESLQTTLYAVPEWRVYRLASKENAFLALGRDFCWWFIYCKNFIQEKRRSVSYIHICI